jgi:autotransporter-associated beta strand protein
MTNATKARGIAVWVATVMTAATGSLSAQIVTTAREGGETEIMVKRFHFLLDDVGDPDGTWTANASGNWSNSADWAGGIIADGGGFANFSTIDITGARTVTINTTSRTVRRIDIGDTNGTHSYNISASGGASLIFDNTANSANAQLNQVATSNGDTISAPIVLNSSLDVTNASSNTLTFSTGDISSGTAGLKTITTSTGNIRETTSEVIFDGSGIVALVHNGPGVLSLSGLNTYSGGTTISGGVVEIGSSGTVNNSGAYVHGPVGVGTLTLNDGATIRSTGTSNRTIQNNLVLNGNIAMGDATKNGILTFNSTQGTNTLSTPATVTLTGNTVLTAQSQVRITDIISGSFSLTKAGPGILRFDGANAYSGGTFITGGTLIANGDGALGTGNVSLTASGVTLTLQNGALNNYVADSATLSIVTGAVTNLNFTGRPDIVSGLVLGGNTETTPGTYGAVGSGANFQSAFFTGTGEIELVPEPTTWALLVSGGAILCGILRFRRKYR